ncbi:MAG: hypothetical protein AAGE84_20640 [Cyanobacteria bacterium P01_G01_bin.39]
MPVHIIRPKQTFSQSLNLAAVKLDPASRQKQIADLIDLQQADKQYQEVGRWTEEVKDEIGINIIKSSQQSGITGTTIVEMSEEEAKKASQNLAGDAEVLRDRPIELIRPANKDTLSFRG